MGSCITGRSSSADGAVIHYEQLLHLRLRRQFLLEVGWLYFYAEQVGDPYAERKDYTGVCTVIWETPHRVWLNALRADLDRRTQRDLIEWLLTQRIKCVKAERAPGRTLPFARRVDDHFEIDVAELAERVRDAEVAKPHRRAADPPPP